MAARRTEYTSPTSMSEATRTPELTDEQLMARVAMRDSAAFELLYDRHAAIVLGIAVKIGGDRAVGEEVLQEAYWRLWNQAESYDPAKGPLRPWLFSIARRQALDVLRRQSVRPAAARDDSEARRLETAGLCSPRRPSWRACAPRALMSLVVVGLSAAWRVM